MESGHCYCSSFNKKRIKQKDRNNDNWVSSQFICIDVDNCSITFNDFLSNLKQKPTYAYTSFNNGEVGKGYRYRLFYLFDTVIEDKDLFEKLYWSIESRCERDNHYKNDDPCGHEVARKFAGNAREDKQEFVCTICYSFSDILIEGIEAQVKKKNVTSKRKVNKNCKECKKEKTFIDKNFITFFNENSTFDAYNKYLSRYELVFNTPLPIVSDEQSFIPLPKDYIEIRYPFYIKTIYDEKGRKIKKVPTQKKLKNGERRRDFLWRLGMFRRMIKPNITFDELLFNMIYDFLFHIDNTEDKITKFDILEKCNKVWDANLDNYSTMSNNMKRSKFKVNKAYSKKYRLEPRQALGIARSDYTSFVIGSMYDCSLSDSENANLMTNNGYPISLSSIRRFRVNNGIKSPFFKNAKNANECTHFDNNNQKKEKDVINEMTTPKKKIAFLKILVREYYNQSITDVENLERLKEKGFDKSLRTLKNYMKELGITKYNKDKGMKVEDSKKEVEDKVVEERKEVLRDKPIIFKMARKQCIIVLNNRLSYKLEKAAVAVSN